MGYKDLDGTSKRSFQIGHRRLSGAITALFRNTAGTGTLSWNPTANRTLTLPNQSGELGLAGNQFLAHATFSALGGSVTTNFASNLTVTRIGTGNYQCTFGAAASSTNYGIVPYVDASYSSSDNAPYPVNVSNKATTGFQLWTRDVTGTLLDPEVVTVVCTPDTAAASGGGSSSGGGILGRFDKSADYTFALGDKDHLIALTGSTARTFTVPLSSSVAFPAGSIIHLIQDGTGILSIAPTGGVTLRSAGNRRRSAEQYSPLTLLRDPATTDLWYLFGDLIT